MSTPEPSPGFTPRTVRCPACGQPARYAPDNPWRPFCSARCKQVDLGAWASEAYRVPDPTPPAPDPEAPPH
ncbi:DNA gyrase inhibitor YacG [Tepidimonas alkaliphilus]|uniref:DNA gyrase inhibitor YacG n=1 Tax=Tepidimonas alkaliphilus TaxID=2588942 RepID=A0A554WCQ6_9BURK|nr:DNA gyrase inhibitor YacG [Tepidimonas alkaliphilus]TSE21361.1 DNA gyrase inhibitor YacG [Tepidimonas alkaliphilus]